MLDLLTLLTMQKTLLQISAVQDNESTNFIFVVVTVTAEDEMLAPVYDWLQKLKNEKTVASV